MIFNTQKEKLKLRAFKNVNFYLKDLIRNNYEKFILLFEKNRIEKLGLEESRHFILRIVKTDLEFLNRIRDETNISFIPNLTLKRAVEDLNKIGLKEKYKNLSEEDLEFEILKSGFMNLWRYDLASTYDRDKIHILDDFEKKKLKESSVNKDRKSNVLFDVF